MLPPNFVRHLEAKDVHPPHCFECIRFAHFEREGEVCMKYGAFVLLCSSCDSFSLRTDAMTPIVHESDINEKFRVGLNDLRRQVQFSGS